MEIFLMTKDLKVLLCDDDRDKIQEIVFWTSVEHGLIEYDMTTIPDFHSVDFELTTKEIKHE
tara:strand:+ start:2246 stop:2431 length:186 start_codon:yes stop_codon:yes gene_type:complete